MAETSGEEGLSWLSRQAKKEISAEVLEKIAKNADDYTKYSDELMEIMGLYEDRADDIIEYVNKNGDEGVEEICERYKSGNKTGTVWDNITSTADNIPGTEIPATFQIDLNGNINYINPTTGTNTLWTNTNATKHMGEYISRFGDESWSVGVRSQAMLESYSASLNEAMKELMMKDAGRYFGTYGNWELGINTKTGIVFHALMVD